MSSSLFGMAVAALSIHATPGLWAAVGGWPTTIFSPSSTPAESIRNLSFFVLTITGLIFVSMLSLLVYTLVRYRSRPGEAAEPPQVFGSTQIELAWTIIPILIIVVLFLATARVIFAIQDAPEPPTGLNVVVVGHQFWWEFRYPQYGVVTANELHIPVSSAQAPRPSFLKLTSADVIHSFWVPRLAGKTDLLPNRVNEMWLDPHETGVYKGQCAQFCGAEHAKMLLRIYVDSPQQFQSWIEAQQQPAGAQLNPQAAAGRRVFEQQACINCHTVAGTVANGRFGPDLTHLMSRETIAAGATLNTADNLQAWISNPDTFKPGCLMPAMHLTTQQDAAIVAYLTTLH